MDKSDIIDYIIENVNELPMNNRQEIKNVLIMAGLREKIQEKGNGIQINTKNISANTLKKLHQFIQDKLSEQKLDIYDS